MSRLSLSRIHRSLTLAFCLPVAGCDKKPDPPPSDSSSDVRPATKPKPKAPASVEPLASNKVVEQVVSDWVRAQNEGDFQAYQKLYAKKFTGLKRSGEREVSFGRQGWMDDRGKMFEKPFTVVAKDVSVSFAPNVAMATFEQTWKSSTYEDRGTKRLLFVKDGDQIRISREEMLTSDTGTERSVLEIPFEKAALAAKTLDSFALLIPGRTDINWATDHPRYISNDRAQRAVSVPALPARVKKHVEARYEVFDASGKRCEVEPRGFQLMVHVIPHFGTVNFWEGRMGTDEPPAIVPNQGRALDLWEMAVRPFQTEASNQGLTLALEMKEAKDCDDPVWGRVIDEKNPAPWTVEKPTGAAAKSLKDAMAGHPIVASLNQVARKQYASSSDWYEGARNESLIVLKSGTGTELVYAEALGMGGCAYDTPTSVGLMFRKQGDSLIPSKDEFYPDGLIRAAIDLDQDGEVELIAETSILSKSKNGYARSVDLSPLFLDCPC